MSVKAISYEEFSKQYEPTIPDFIFESVNDLLFKKWNGESATITQDEIIENIKIPEEYESKVHFRQLIFDKGWLNFENAYIKKGWNVSYSKPMYYEDWCAYFEFTKKD